MDENEIIEMLAREKRIIIDDTDPIFAQYHLNEILISKFNKTLNSNLLMANDNQQEKLEQIIDTVNKDIEGSLNKSLFFSKKSMDEEFDLRINEMISKLKKETNNYNEHLNNHSTQIKKLTYINITISLVMTIFMSIFIYNIS